MPPLDHQSRVLVTGATGFIGAHIVDQLLQRGVFVRGASRSQAKAQRMKDARQQYASQLEFVTIGDFTGETNFDEAVEGVDGIVHTASELIIPAIKGTKALLSAASKTGRCKRIVMTSSFASFVDINKRVDKDFVYNGDNWNPLTYEEAADPKTNSVVAYRGSKKFAEVAAWDFVKDVKPSFDLVTFCPPMTFGPVVHPVSKAEDLNESNAGPWDVALGKPLPEQRVPVWVDVRDLAQAHVEALFSENAGMKRYAIASPENWSYEVAEAVLKKRSAAKKGESADTGDVKAKDGYGLDWKPVMDDLGVEFHGFEQCILDLFEGLEKKGEGFVIDAKR